VLGIAYYAQENASIMWKSLVATYQCGGKEFCSPLFSTNSTCDDWIKILVLLAKIAYSQIAEYLTTSGHLKEI